MYGLVGSYVRLSDAPLCHGCTPENRGSREGEEGKSLVGLREWRPTGSGWRAKQRVRHIKI